MNSLEEYKKEIKSYKKLKPWEEKKLIEEKRYEELIKSFLYLVLPIAKSLAKNLKHLEEMDLINEGNLILVNAIYQNDLNQPNLRKHLNLVIYRGLIRYIKENDNLITIPNSYVDLLNKYTKLIKKYNDQKERIPSDDELCRILNITNGMLENIRIRSSFTIMPLESSYNLPNDENALLEKVYSDDLLLILKTFLSKCHYYYLYHYVISSHPKNLAEISTELHITRSSSSEHYVSVVKKVKKLFSDKEQFNKLLSEVRIKENGRINYIKTMPISITDICLYLYLSPYLDYYEAQILGLELLGDYHYSSLDYATILGIDPERVKKIETDLKQKIQELVAIDLFAIDKFKEFKDSILELYQGKIFTTYEIIDNVIFNYEYLNRTYLSLDFEELINLFNMDLCKEDYKAISKIYKHNDNCNNRVSLAIKKRGYSLLLMLDNQLKDKNMAIKLI